MMERAVPLGDSQRIMLLNLIKEHEKIITDKSTGSTILVRKREAWDDITKKFNSIYPDQHPRSPMQIKRCFDHVKRKVKQEDATMKKKLRTTGGGPVPDFPKASEEFVIAASLMSEELNMDNDVIETYHPVDETGEHVHDVSLSITEPLPSTSAQLESSTSILAIETPSKFIIRSTSSSPSSMENLFTKPLLLHDKTSPSSTPTATPDRPSRKSHSTSRDVSPVPRPSTVIQESHSSTKRMKVEDAYVKCREKQEELHNLKIENEKEKNLMAKKEHELKVELINKMSNLVDNMQTSAMTVFNNLNTFLNSGNSAYEAMRNAYE